MPAKHTRRPARATLYTEDDARNVQRYATAAERDALRITLLSMYATARITRGEYLAAVTALGLRPLHD